MENRYNKCFVLSTMGTQVVADGHCERAVVHRMNDAGIKPA